MKSAHRLSQYAVIAVLLFAWLDGSVLLGGSVQKADGDKTDLLLEKYNRFWAISNEDLETFQANAKIITETFYAILAVRGKNQDEASAIKNPENVAEARKICRLIIEKHRGALLLPGDTFPFTDVDEAPVFRQNRELVFVHRTNDKRFGLIQSFLWNDSEILFAQKDFEGIADNLTFYVSFAERISLTGWDACHKQSACMTDILRLTRKSYPLCSPECREKFDGILDRMSRLLVVLPKEFHNAVRYQATFLLPELLEGAAPEICEEINQIVDYLANLSKYEPDFFDMEKGPICDEEAILAKHAETNESLISNIRMYKDLMLAYRDNCYNRLKIIKKLREEK